MTETKKWYKSKTIWMAVLTVLLGVGEFIQGQQTTGAAITLVGVANVLLRLVTAQAVNF